MAKDMARLTDAATEIWIATAFVSDDAVQQLLPSALGRGATVRFLTGTFGRQTRRKTFARLMRLAERHQNLEVRIWTCGTHQDFHAKLYVWRNSSGPAVAWIGSANFTNRGLQERGELMLEARGAWGQSGILDLRRAYELEWRRGFRLSEEFIRRYQEAPLSTACDLGKRASRPAVRRKRRVPTSRYFTATVGYHFSERSAVAARVDDLLGGTATAWFRHAAKSLRNVKTGDRGVLFDSIDKTASLIDVTDRETDGHYRVFAYDVVATVGWTQVLAKRFDMLGLVPRANRLSATLGRAADELLRKASKNR